MPIWKRTPDIAQLNARNPGTLAAALGIEFTEFGDDFVSATMPVDERTRQPFGLLHGGASVALAENLASVGAMLCLDPQARGVVGLEINANHLRAIRDGQVTGTARPVHLGSTTQVWEIRIEDEQGRAVCISRCTLAVLQAAKE